MPFDPTKFHRYCGDPLIPVWVMDALRAEAAADGVTVNTVIARWLSAQARRKTKTGNGARPHKIEGD